jgi:hypothetical protein
VILAVTLRPRGLVLTKDKGLKVCTYRYTFTKINSYLCPDYDFRFAIAFSKSEFDLSGNNLEPRIFKLGREARYWIPEGDTKFQAIWWRNNGDISAKN